MDYNTCIIKFMFPSLLLNALNKVRGTVNNVIQAPRNELERKRGLPVGNSPFGGRVSISPLDRLLPGNGDQDLAQGPYSLDTRLNWNNGAVRPYVPPVGMPQLSEEENPITPWLLERDRKKAYRFGRDPKTGEWDIVEEQTIAPRKRLGDEEISTRPLPIVELPARTYTSPRRSSSKPRII